MRAPCVLLLCPPCLGASLCCSASFVSGASSCRPESSVQSSSPLCTYRSQSSPSGSSPPCQFVSTTVGFCSSLPYAHLSTGLSTHPGLWSMIALTSDRFHSSDPAGFSRKNGMFGCRSSDSSLLELDGYSRLRPSVHLSLLCQSLWAHRRQTHCCLYPLPVCTPSCLVDCVASAEQCALRPQ